MEISNFNIVESIKSIGLAKTLFAFIVLSCHFYIFRLYNARLKDRQKEIDRLAEDNREYRDRFMKLLDKNLIMKIRGVKMFFTVISTILVLSLALNFFKIKRHIKHDKYLYKFCQLRREIMSYLRINHDVLSKTEYQATKQILDVLNIAINLYSKNEASNLFNIRKFAKFVSETKHLSDSSKKLIECNNSTIKDFRDKLKRNIICNSLNLI